MPKVRYKGPKDKHIEARAEGTVCAIKDKDGDAYRGCAVMFPEVKWAVWFADSLDDMDARSHYLKHLELVTPVAVDEAEPATGHLFRQVIVHNTIRQVVTPEQFKAILLRDRPSQLFHERLENGTKPLYDLKDYTDKSVEVSSSGVSIVVGFDALYTKLALMDITLFTYKHDG